MVTATETMDLPVVQEVAHAELDRQFPGEKITLRQLIVGVAELLDDPAHWTTGALAKNASGQSVAPTDPTATCWCGIGATYKVYYDLTGTKVFDTAKQDRLVLKITQRLMQSSAQMLVGRRVESMNDAKDGHENLQRVMPLALSIIEHAIENQQGALGEALGTVGIVDPEHAPDEHEHVQSLESQNPVLVAEGGPVALDPSAPTNVTLHQVVVGEPLPVEDLPDTLPMQGQEQNVSPKAEGSQGSSSVQSQDAAGATDSATSATDSTTDTQ